MNRVEVRGKGKVHKRRKVEALVERDLAHPLIQQTFWTVPPSGLELAVHADEQ